MALPAGRYGVTKNQLLKIKKLPMNTIKLIEELTEKFDLLGSAAFKNSTSVVTESTDLVESGAVKDIVGWGNKNNLSIPTSVSTQSLNGIDYTFHRNSDGAVTKIDVVGTATSDSRLAWFIPDTFVQDETYKLTGWDVRSITQGKVVNFAITFMGVQGSRYILNATDTELEYTCNKTGYSSIENAIYVQTGTTIDASIYPMNRKATVSDSTFEPYHASVKDSLAEKCDNSVIAPVENGSTASQAYAVGEHFIRDGAFCTCKQAISQGGSFTLNTNYTAGDVAGCLIKQDTFSGTTSASGTLIPLYNGSDRIILGFKLNTSAVVVLPYKSGDGTTINAVVIGTDLNPVSNYEVSGTYYYI